jgi:hypothetical protein
VAPFLFTEVKGRIIDKINEYVNFYNYCAKEGNPLYE